MNPNPPLRWEQLTHLLHEGKIGHVEQYLTSITPSAKWEQRMWDHSWARVLFAKGDLNGAKAKVEAARAAWGDNVNLVRDHAIFLYHLQDMSGFRTVLAELQVRLEELGANLHWQSLYECELTVGKFLEEEAHLAPAMTYYDRALRRARSTNLRLRAQLQKARWMALYQTSPELATLYRELISVAPKSIPRDLAIEFEHTLMLVELGLVGPDHAWLRCQRLSSNTAEIDQRLVAFDFLEGCLAQILEVPSSVLSFISKFKTLDPYEEYLRMLVQGSLEPDRHIETLNLLATKLPWASYLRLLYLTSNLNIALTSKHELHRKIQLITADLDVKSQEIWNLRLTPRSPEPNRLVVEFCGRARALRLQGRHLDLTKKKTSLQLLTKLSQNVPLSVDQAIRDIWNTPFSLEHYQRLRMTVHRLNSLLHSQAGLEKMIEVDSQEVRIRPDVKLTYSEN